MRISSVAFSGDCDRIGMSTFRSAFCGDGLKTTTRPMKWRFIRPERPLILLKVK